jgi:hypothetical protein
MADLGQIQKRLKSDNDYRAKFLANPIQALRDEGIEITPDMARKLTAFTMLTHGSHGDIAGSSVARGGSIEIDISIHF